MIDRLEAKFQALEIEHELQQMKAKSRRSLSDSTSLENSPSVRDRAPNPAVSDKIDRFYNILGLRSDASLKEVKQAYRALLKKWHPDLFYDNPKRQENAQDFIKKMNAIYSEVCDRNRF